MDKIIFSIEVQGTEQEISQINQLEKEMELLAVSMTKLKGAGKELSKEFIEQSVQMQELRKTRNTIIKSIERQNTTMVEEKNTLRSVTAQISLYRNQLQDAEVGSEAFKRIAAKIKELEQVQRNANIEMGRGELFIGEYDKAVDGAAKSVGRMKKELIALRNTSLEGKSEQEIKQLNKRIGELQDNLQDLKAQQAAFGMEFGAAIAGSLKFVAAGVEGVVGSMELLGLGAEDAQKAQKSLMGLIAVTQALGEIEDILQKKTLQVTAAKIKDGVITAKDTVIRWLNVGAAKAQGQAIEGVEKSTKKGGGAMSVLTGIMSKFKGVTGLVVAGVAAIGYGVYELVKSLSNGSATWAAYTETMEEAMKNSAKDRVELNALAMKINATTQGTKEHKEAIDELNSKFGDAIGYTLSYSASQDDLKAAIDAGTESLIKRAQQEAIMTKLTELYQTRVEKAAENSTYFGDAVDYASQNILSTSSSLEDVEEEIARYEQLLGATMNTGANLIKINDNMGDSFKKLYTEVNKQRQAEFEMQQQRQAENKLKQDILKSGEEAIKQAKEAEKKQQEDSKRSAEELNNFLISLRKEYALVGANEIQKERILIDQWYKEQQEKAMGNKEALLMIDKLYEEKKKNLFIKQLQAEDEAEKKRREEEKKKLEELQQYEFELADESLEQQYAIEAKALEGGRLKFINQLLWKQKYTELNLKEQEQLETEQLKTSTEYALMTEEQKQIAISFIQEKYEKERRQKQLDNFNMFAEHMKGVLDAVAMFQEAAYNKELAAAGDNEEKKAEIEKKYAEKKQKTAVKMAIISGAQAVLNALLTQPFIPAGLAAGVVAGIQTAAQIALIKSQKFERGGMLRGRSHAQGGIYLGGGVEAEGGEAIINKRSTRKFMPLLNAINTFNGFGNPIRMASGGVLPPSQPIMIPTGNSQKEIDLGIERMANLIVSGINDKKVIVTEKDITDRQLRNQRIKTQTTY